MNNNPNDLYNDKTFSNSQLMTRRGALCAAAGLGVSLFLPNDVFADEESGTSVDPQQDDRLAQSWRFKDGAPITPETNTDDDGIMLLGDGIPYGKNSAGQWCNGRGDAIPGALLRGVDVSYFQFSIDWNAVKASGVDYAIIRAAWSAPYTDPSGTYHDGIDSYWNGNASACERVGMPYGAYIYSYARTAAEAVREAEHLIGLMRGHKPTYPLYIDIEDDKVVGADLNAVAIAFCRRIEQAGYQAGVYANLSFWNKYLTSSTLNNWTRWIAQYNATCDYGGRYDMWQCTSSGGISGINGSVDINFDYVDLSNEYSSQTTWTRVYGQSHLDTMLEISKTGWGSSDAVVIATERTYWDALSASALAGYLGCPILLTYTGALSNQAKSEIQRLGAKTAYVVGGNIAIADAVDSQIRAAGCPTVQRVFGQDQQGTARAIAEFIRKKSGAQSKTCIIATSWKFQDALSVSPFAFWSKSPIYLCETGSNTLSDATVKSIQNGGFTKAIIVGGPVAVNSSVEGQLRGIGLSNVKRVYGQTEYETSQAIAEWEISEGMGVSNMAVATGETYYDALSGGALCGKNGSVLTIVHDTNRVCLTDLIPKQKGKVSHGFVFGGPIAVSKTSWLVLLRNYLY